MDRAALDAGLESGLRVGGWCPRGRLAEDGPIPCYYPLQETPSGEYSQRTEWNVRDSEATLILASGPLEGGTFLALTWTRHYGRPALVVDLTASPGTAEAVAWLKEHEVSVLNIAGPRASESPGIYERAAHFLTKLFREWAAFT